MSDKVLGKSFDKAGPVGKVIIGFCVFAALFLSVLTWSVAQNSTVLNEMVRQNNNIETLVDNQGQLDVFRRCIKVACDDANEYFNEEILKTIGDVLSEYSVPFPDNLNENLLKYGKKTDFIKDCLIFPEDLK